MQLGSKNPPACPDETPEFKQSETLLKAAMKAATTHSDPK
jgi:hypothetical protein